MANPLRLLIVTDSKDSALLIVRELGQEGYEPVRSASIPGTGWRRCLIKAMGI